jgi:hypothetical protein
MNLRVLPLPLLLACIGLASCGPSTRSLSYRAPSDTMLGQCQRQADDDPKVQQLLLQNFNLVADPPHDQALRQARIDATNRCLRARGVDLPGGVEPVNKSGYLF